MPPRKRRIKLIEGETSDFCLRYEKLFIGYYGKKHDGTGILRNIADGGKGSKGFKHTEAHKQRQSLLMTGVSKSDEMKVKMREVAASRPKGYYKNFGDSNKAERVFVHDIHGEFRCSQSELCAMFPELAQGNLSKVVRGIIKQHKGFRCLTPSADFVKKSHSNMASIQKRLANNADKVGMDVAAYAALHHITARSFWLQPALPNL